MDEDQIFQLCEKIADLQFCIQDMCIDYFCFDYRIIMFYNMNPLEVLSRITSNIDLVGDENKLNELISQVRDFIEYYKVDDDDVFIIKENVKIICNLLNVDFIDF